MPQPTGAVKAQPPVVQEYQPWAAFLSYLVPGLGQIYQGRVAKGILFLVCVYGLFFYGMALGSWKNVYLGDTMERNNPLDLPRLLANLYNRPQFLGQFWVGIAAWPAILQYNRFDKNAEADPVLGTFERQPYESRAPAAGPQGLYEAPNDWPGKTVNELQIEGDKTWDLAWVYTVIAGVLNVLIIYDALAGPAFGVEREPKPAPQEEKKGTGPLA